MNRLIRHLTPLVLAAFLLVFGGSANAQKVANPGTFNFKLTSGVMQVKNQEFTFDESQNINFNGTVDKAGNISIPTITFPSYPISASGFNLTVKINVVGPSTGTINPLTGAVSLRLKVWIKIDGVPFGGDCRIASSTSPIDVNTLITGASGSRTGTPYNLSTGTMRIVNSTYAVPASSSCGPAAGTVDSTVGLPSPAGNNGADFNIKSTPIANRGIVPALTVTPASGTAPFNATLNASGSTVASGPATYRWDFTNDGSIDQTTSTPTTTRTYTVGGTSTARVQVVDSDGDVAETTRQFTVNAFPDLAIAANHDADFRVGSIGRYRVSLANQGYAATSGPVTVTSTLPAGLTYAGVSGSGWGCSAAGQAVTCSRSVAIGVGANAPELAIDLNVAPEARGELTPTFTVAVTGDNGPGNNSASDPTQVRATDLRLSVSHPSHAMLLGPDPANVIELSVENIGDAATAGPIVIVDELPAGLTPLGASGAGWGCGITGQTVTCTHAGPIAPGASAPVVTVTVDAALEPGQLGVTVDNEATVSTADDIDLANNTATDPTLILDGQDVGIVKSHQEDFTAGQNEHYELAVENQGTQPTTGPTTVTDTLPAGLGFVAADGGPSWSCSETGGTVTCVHDDPIAAGATAPPIDLTVAVGSAAIPGVVNTAGVSTPDDPNPVNDSSTDNAVVQAIDLEIVKSHQGQIRVGQQAVYRLAVGNVGDSPSVGPATVTDTLPAGLGFVSADGGPGWSCDESAGTLTCEYAASLAPNEHAPDITLITAVGPAAAPAVVNEAAVDTQDDFNSANNQATDSAVVIDVDTSVSISRTGSFRPGQNGTYLIVARNEGAVPTAHPTDVTVDLPAGLEFDSATGDGWNCGEADGTVTCSLPAGLGAGATAPMISLRVAVTPAAVPGVETTVTAATEGDRYPDNDSATDTASIVGPDLGIGSYHEGAFRVGTAHSYLLDVTNHGNGPTVGPITVTDTLPAGFTATAAFGGGWSCGIAGLAVTCERAAALAAGGSAGQIRVDVTPTAAALPPGQASATVDNEVSVATATDGNAANDTAGDSTDLVAVDLALGLSGPDSAEAGGIVEYDLTVDSVGSAATNGVVRVVDVLPVGFTARPSGGDGWTCSSAGRKVTCEYSLPVPAGGNLPDLTVRSRAGNAALGTAVNQATVSTQGDIEAGNDSSSATTDISAAPDLEFSLQARSQGGQKIRVGNDSGYVAVVRNSGTASTSAPVSVQIELPAGLSFLTLDSGQGWACSPAGADVTCEHGGMIAAGEISSFGFLVSVSPSAPAVISVSGSIAPGTDLNPENDAAVSVDQVVRLDLALTRTHASGWTRGRAGSYALQIVNEGSAATTGPVTMTETLPLGTTFVAATGEGWDCQVSGRTLSCVNADTLNPGDVSDLGITLNVGASASSSIEASSRISTVGDVNSANDSATETIPVAAEPRPNESGPVKVRTAKTTPTRNGIVTVWLECPLASPAKCVGTLALRTAGKVKLNARKRVRLSLGQAGFAVSPGRAAPVRVRVRAAGRKALRLNPTIRAEARATNVGGGPSRRTILIRKAR